MVPHMESDPMNQPLSPRRAVVVACRECAEHIAVDEFLKHLWKVTELSLVEEAAPETIFAEGGDAAARSRLCTTVDALLEDQPLKYLAIVSHCGCAMNAAPYEGQITMLRQSVDHLNAKYPDMKTAGIWVDHEGSPLKFEF